MWRLRPSRSPLPLALRRLSYNLALPVRLPRERLDLIIGVDLDGFLLRRRGGPPRVVALKGVAADEARFEGPLAAARLRARARLEAGNARRADRVIVPSRYSRRVVLERYGLPPERVRVVPEGVDPDFWGGGGRPGAPEGRAAADRRGAGAPRGEGRPPTILSVARQYPRKNTAALLRALPGVLRAVPEARLRVVGGGPELPRLRRLARRLGVASAVRFLGTLPSAEAVRAEHRRADVFCLPSLQEGFGIAFLEAMASGLPVVALRAAAVPEVVPHGRAGLLVPPGRPEALREGLVRLLRDSALRARFGRAGRRRAEGFRWEGVAERFLRASLGTCGPTARAAT